MSNSLDLLLIVTLLVEVGVLTYLEHRAWGGWLTPLNMLMLPYVAVLGVTMIVAGGSLGFVNIYYPSIFIWIIGLFLFAMPSFLLAYIVRDKKDNVSIITRKDETPMSPMLIALSFFFSFIFLLHLRSTLGGSVFALGSDEFAEDLSGFGLWAHLRVFTIPLLMMCIYYWGRKRWWLLFPILAFLVVSMLAQVKGWTIIPCIAALMMRVYGGRTKLTWKLVLSVALGAFLVFFGSYWLSILVVQEREVSDDFMEFIFGHFFHYLTSGILGWSMDLERGLPDADDHFEIIIAQFVNLGKTLTGDKNLVDPINPLFYNTGRTITNVRTIFGTLYIHTTPIGFTLYLWVLSIIMYALFLALRKWKNIYLLTIYFFNCTLLFMGWFDLYFANLTIFEVPIFTLLMLLGNTLWIRHSPPVPNTLRLR